MGGEKLGVSSEKLVASTILGVGPEKLAVSIKWDLGPEKLAVPINWGSTERCEKCEKLVGLEFETWCGVFSDMWVPAVCAKGDFGS